MAEKKTKARKKAEKAAGWFGGMTGKARDSIMSRQSRIDQMMKPMKSKRR